MPPKISPVGSSSTIPSASAITNLTTQTPVSDDLFAFVAVPTSRVVRITALGQGTLTKYLRVRASAGGTILATGTVSAAATSATVINRGAGTAAQYAAQIVLWFAAGTNTTAIGTPTVTQDGADVVVTFPTGTAYNTYVFETDDTQLSIADAQTGTDAVLRKVSKAEMGVVCVLGSVTVDLNTTDLQLSQVVVPTGKVCVVTGEIVRNASVDLTSLELRLTTGWNAGADNLWSSNPIYNFHQKQLTLLTTSNLTIGRSSLYPRDGEGDLATADNAL